MTEQTRQEDLRSDGQSSITQRPEEQPGTSEGRRVVELLWAYDLARAHAFLGLWA